MISDGRHTAPNGYHFLFFFTSSSISLFPRKKKRKRKWITARRIFFHVGKFWRLSIGSSVTAAGLLTSYHIAAAVLM
jgi:hypothetical protein